MTGRKHESKEASNPMKTLQRLIPLAAAAAGTTTLAHTWNAGDNPADREARRAHMLSEWEQSRPRPAPREISPPKIVSSALPLGLAATAVANAANAPATAKAFLPFTRLDLRADDRFLYVGSNGLPDHNMMVGITAWQQQVPLPQTYFGDNAWRIPLKPVPAKEPAMIKGRFLRGAIALAANGIPIFNPQNNRGEVSYEIGELDQWGGHCGRADDYHYHVAPLHLQNAVGKGHAGGVCARWLPDLRPDRAGRLAREHRWMRATVTSRRGAGYHYHASTKYPYVIGGFHGEVVEADEQVDPQPRAQAGARVIAGIARGEDHRLRKHGQRTATSSPTP